jgi:hypothetical protein
VRAALERSRRAVGGDEAEPSARRWPLVLVAVAAALTVGLVATTVVAGRPGSAPDALEARILGEVDGFLGWLERHEVEGVLGEVSWPNDDPDGRWASLGQRWLARADAAGAPVAYWAAGEVWNQESVPYLAFTASGGSGAPVDTVQSPGEVLAGSDGVGLNAAGGSYNSCSRQPTCGTLHNRKRGRLGVEWRFDSQASLDFYADHGVTWLRLPIRWERLQPDLGEALDPEVADALDAVLDRAHAAGLGVVLDLHNFGGYYAFDGETGVRRALGVDLGSDDLADVWLRVADRFGGHAAVRAWGLMNEPVDMGDDGRRRWEEISQDVVDRLRAGGDRTRLYVAGYDLGNVHDWPHTEPWIDDPLDRVRYEAHHHWDRHHGARYDATSAEELRLAADD